MKTKTMTGVEQSCGEKIGKSGQTVFKQFGYSEIGPLHKKRQLPNQDAFCRYTYSWGELIALSDGLGSHALSQFVMLHTDYYYNGISYPSYQLPSD